MLNLFVLSPLIIVIIASLLARYAMRRRSFAFGADQWAAICCFTLVALLLPLTFGVWTPDLLGFEQVVVSSQTLDGHGLSVHQVWGSDFYETSLHRTRPDGTSGVEILDPDGSKLWNATIQLDESARLATISYGSGRSRNFHW